MKTLLLILLPIISYSQCEYRVNEVDEFTGNVKKIIKSEKIAPRLTSYLARIGDLTAIYFWALDDLGCVSSRSYVILKYTDGTTEEIKHVTGIDCGSPTFTGVIETGKAVEKIRLHFDTTQDYVVKDQDFIINGLECVK